MGTELPAIEGYEVLAGPTDSARELTDLITALQVHFSASRTVSEDVVATLLSEPGTDHLQVRLTDSADLVGAAMFENPEPHVESQTRVWVHPDHMNRGIGSALTAWGLAQGREEAPLAPEGSRVINICLPRDAGDVAIGLLEDHGYHVSRYFLEMTIDLGGEVEKPTFPADVTVRTIRDEDGIDLVADAQHEAFRDHFGWIDRSPQSRHAEWSHWRSSQLWQNDLVWLVEAGDHIVAILTAIDKHGSSEDVGYIAVVGVLKEWRGRGIAKALLRTAISEFHRRGKRAVALHVDAQNLTGATRLYERVGMRETAQEATYEFVIRSGEDLTVR